MEETTPIIVNGRKAKVNKVEAVIPFLNRPHGDEPHAWGYGRVSTLDQDTSGMAGSMVTMQHYKLRYEPVGFKWGGWFCDGAAAGSSPFEDRDAAKAIISLMQPGDVIIVHKSDRFYRSLLDYAKTIEALTEIGVNLYTCDTGLDTSTDMGEMICGITAVIAQGEKKRMSTRRKEQIAAMDLAGLCFLNGQSLGFDKQFVKLLGTKKAYRCVPNLRMQIALERVFHWREIQFRSQLDISMWLCDCKLGAEGVVQNGSWEIRRDVRFTPAIVKKYHETWENIAETSVDLVQYLTPEERIAFYNGHQPRNPFTKSPGRPNKQGRSRESLARFCGVYGPDYEQYQRERAAELCASAGKPAMEIINDILAGYRRPANEAT